MLQITEVVTRLHVWSSSGLLSCSESRSPRGATGTDNNLNNSAVQLRVNQIELTRSFPLSVLKEIIIIIVMVMMKIHTYSITDMKKALISFGAEIYQRIRHGIRLSLCIIDYVQRDEFCNT